MSKFIGPLVLFEQGLLLQNREVCALEEDLLDYPQSCENTDAYISVKGL